MRKRKGKGAALATAALKIMEVPHPWERVTNLDTVCGGCGSLKVIGHPLTTFLLSFGPISL